MANAQSTWLSVKPSGAVLPEVPGLYIVWMHQAYAIGSAWLVCCAIGRHRDGTSPMLFLLGSFKI